MWGAARPPITGAGARLAPVATHGVRITPPTYPSAAHSSKHGEQNPLDVHALGLSSNLTWKSSTGPRASPPNPAGLGLSATAWSGPTPRPGLPHHTQTDHCPLHQQHASFGLAASVSADCVAYSECSGTGPGPDITARPNSAARFRRSIPPPRRSHPRERSSRRAASWCRRR